MINVLLKTPEFEAWLEGLTDIQGKMAVVSRMLRAEDGNFGDCEPVGGGVYEMRVFAGPGYRVYFVRTSRSTYIMLWASDKTDQPRAIKRAKAILKALRGD